jgi:16S rRNA (uracil1498-N3)-methyltransferase
VLPASAAHVFVDDVVAPALSDVDAHHVFRVLRVRPGELVTVSDGRGEWRACRAGAESALEPEGDIVRVARSEPAITIAFALTKGDRPEWVVQKLTELGVDRIVPMTTDHVVVKWSADKTARAHGRFTEVMRAAAMQARLAWLPEIAPVTSFRDAVADASVALAHPGGAAPSLQRPTVLVGPEGGWSAAELAAAPVTVDLGDTNLRADTAAMAAAVRLTALRAGAN